MSRPRPPDASHKLKFVGLSRVPPTLSKGIETPGAISTVVSLFGASVGPGVGPGVGAGVGPAGVGAGVQIAFVKCGRIGSNQYFPIQ